MFSLPSNKDVTIQQIEEHVDKYKRYSILGIYDDLVDALFDLELHSQTSEEPVSSLKIFQEIRQKFKYTDEEVIPSICPFTRTTHLVHYGSMCFGYTACRMFSAAIWSDLFGSDPRDPEKLLSRESGELLRRHYFAHANTKDPLDIVKSLVGDAPLYYGLLKLHTTK